MAQKKSDKPTVTLTPAKVTVPFIPSPPATSLVAVPLPPAFPPPLKLGAETARERYTELIRRLQEQTAALPPLNLPEPVAAPSELDIEQAKLAAQAQFPTPLPLEPKPAVFPEYAAPPQRPTRPRPEVDPVSAIAAGLASLFAGEYAGQIAAAPLNAALANAERTYQDRLAAHEEAWRLMMEQNRQAAERAQIIREKERETAETLYKRALIETEGRRAAALAPAFSSLAAREREARLNALQAQKMINERQAQMEAIRQTADQLDRAQRELLALQGIEAELYKTQYQTAADAAAAERRRKHEWDMLMEELKTRYQIAQLNTAVDWQRLMHQMGTGGAGGITPARELSLYTDYLKIAGDIEALKEEISLTEKAPPPSGLNPLDERKMMALRGERLRELRAKLKGLIDQERGYRLMLNLPPREEGGKPKQKLTPQEEKALKNLENALRLLGGR